MLSLKEEVQKRCDNKRYFKNMSRAETVARKLSIREKALLIAYKCVDCDGYHVGHADLAQRMAHVPKKKVRWRVLVNESLKNTCPVCKALPGVQCTQNEPINGRTEKVVKRINHHARATQIMR